MTRRKLSALLDDKKTQIISLALLAVILLVFLIQTYGKAFRPDGNDFTSYLLSAEALLNGQDPYQTGNPFLYVYPLFLALALIPFTLLPYSLAVTLWFGINVFSLACSIYIIIDLASPQLGVRWSKRLSLPLVILFVLTTSIIQNNLLNGQVNFIVLFLTVLFLKYLNARRPLLASLCLALSISIKLVPALLLLFLIFRKHHRSFLYTSIAIIFLCLLPALFLGEQLFPTYRGYIGSFILENISADSERGVIFFTLHGFLSYITAGGLSANWMKAAAALVVLAPIVAGEVVNFRAKKKRGDVWLFSSYLLAILLIAPLSEIHHLVFMLPPLCLTVLKLFFDKRWATTRNQIFLALPFLLLLAGKLIKHGPFYFLSITMLLVITLWIFLRETELKENR